MNQLGSKKNSRFDIDLSIVLPVVLIASIGVVTLLSTTINSQGKYSDLEIVYKQIIFLLIGAVSYYLISRIDLSYLKHWQIIFIIYLTTVILLVATLLFAPTINYVKRWLVIGGIQIQPSEIAKLLVILYSALIISQKQKINEWLLFVISFILTLPIVVLIYLEPDASMSILTLVLWFSVSFLGLSQPLRNTILLTIFGLMSGAFLISSITDQSIWYVLLIPGSILTIFAFYSQNSWKKLVIITTAIALILGFMSSTMWSSILKPYQKDRIVVFINPSETEAGIGFNVNQSRIAIGSGKIWGKGFGNGTQSKRNFLPEHQTDFIFASFAEEFGLAGSIFLLSLYGYLVTKCFLIATNKSQNHLLSLIALGVGIKILLEVCINVGTNTGAIPATGIPLPLMSAGGSITIITLISLALVDNISREKEFKSDIIDM